MAFLIFKFQVRSLTGVAMEEAVFKMHSGWKMTGIK
jgi:hypothetical protein